LPWGAGALNAACCGYRCDVVMVCLASATCLPPDISALYISGAISPEIAALSQLSRNAAMRASVAAFAAAGGVVFGEGLGLCYLSSGVRIGDDGDELPMARVLPLHTAVGGTWDAGGGDCEEVSYVRAEVQAGAPLFAAGAELRGVATGVLDVWQEVPARRLGRHRRSGSADATAALTYSFAVRAEADPGGPVGTAREPATPGRDEWAPEGFTHGRVTATAAHISFAGAERAIAPLLAACRAVDAASVARSAAQRIARHGRSSSVAHELNHMHHNGLLPISNGASMPVPIPSQLSASVPARLGSWTPGHSGHPSLASLSVPECATSAASAPAAHCGSMEGSARRAAMHASSQPRHAGAYWQTRRASCETPLWARMASSASAAQSSMRVYSGHRWEVHPLPRGRGQPQTPSAAGARAALDGPVATAHVLRLTPLLLAPGERAPHALLVVSQLHAHSCRRRRTTLREARLPLH
jgi:CobB/CobQ-like glutamine amidotransferase domain